MQIKGATIELPDGSVTKAALAQSLELTTEQHAQRTFVPTPIPLTSLRVWDAMHTMIVGTPAADDLGLVTGTPGTHAPKVSAGDVKALGSTTRKAAFVYIVPDNYDNGQTLQFKLRCAMETTVADTSCNVDLSVYQTSDATVGSDLVVTAPITMNSLTAADKTFSLSEGTLVAGSILIGVVSIISNDAATATAVTPVIYSITPLVDMRG